MLTTWSYKEEEEGNSSHLTWRPREESMLVCWHFLLNSSSWHISRRLNTVTMSRLIVKNLPNGVSYLPRCQQSASSHVVWVHLKMLTVCCVQMKEDRFRSMFAAFGTVTDCSLKFTKDGKFRKFGFVGFKSEDDANRALKHFNKSFVDTSRVTVWYFLPLLGLLCVIISLWTSGCALF